MMVSLGLDSPGGGPDVNDTFLLAVGLFCLIALIDPEVKARGDIETRGLKVDMANCRFAADWV